MKKLVMGIVCLVASAGLISQAVAVDFNEYKKLAKHTINEVSLGGISHASVDKLIVNQEALIQIGMSAIDEYAIDHPDVAVVLNIVKSNAISMQNLSLSEIEAQWHQGGFMKSKGIDVNTLLGQKSSAGSLMGTIVHPATVIIVLNEYKKKANKKYLVQVKDELKEVLHHIDYIK